jgi:hypothetical protein
MSAATQLARTAIHHHGGVRWKLTRGIPAALLTGLTVGLATGLVDGYGAGLVAGLTGVLFGAAIALRNLEADLSVAVSPISVLKRDIRTAFVFGIAFGILGGLAFGLGAWLAGEVAARLAYGVVGGLIFGMASGLVLSRSAWPHWAVVHYWLALSGKLPWAFMGFLADARTRGILRQSGAVYQFRHRELQRRIASRSEDRMSLENASRPQAESAPPEQVGQDTVVLPARELSTIVAALDEASLYKRHRVATCADCADQSCGAFRRPRPTTTWQSSPTDRESGRLQGGNRQRPGSASQPQPATDREAGR